MRQKGFTLVELAIVMVIIGILLGAIIKGQELINNARTKRVLNDLKGLEAVTWAFFDRYGRMPGDCNLDGRIDAPTNNYVGGLDNNPSLGFCTSTATDGDRDRPWAELKAAQLLSAGSNNKDLARNIFSGSFFIGYAGNGTTWVNAIAVADIPCFAAKAIDVAIDGSLDAAQGRIRQLGDYRTALTGSDAWTVCSSEDTLVDIVYFFDKQP